jgi:hypothetical protein
MVGFEDVLVTFVVAIDLSDLSSGFIGYWLYVLVVSGGWSVAQSVGDGAVFCGENGE